MFPRVGERALGSEEADATLLVARFLDFANTFLAEQMPVNLEAYKAIQEVVSSHPELLDSRLAEVLARCAIVMLEANLEEYYGAFRTFMAKVPWFRFQNLR